MLLCVVEVGGPRQVFYKGMVALAKNIVDVQETACIAGAVNDLLFSERALLPVAQLLAFVQRHIEKCIDDTCQTTGNGLAIRGFNFLQVD